MIHVCNIVHVHVHIHVCIMYVVHTCYSVEVIY